MAVAAVALWPRAVAKDPLRGHEGQHLKPCPLAPLAAVDPDVAKHLDEPLWCGERKNKSFSASTEETGILYERQLVSARGEAVLTVSWTQTNERIHSTGSSYPGKVSLISDQAVTLRYADGATAERKWPDWRPGDPEPDKTPEALIGK
jgi:hypothetical protein